MRLIDPAPPKVTLEQGFSYIKKGELGKAVKVMDALIEGDPYLAQAYWGRALCLEYRAVDLDDINAAISDYSRSIVYSSEPLSLSFGRRGILYFKAGLYEEALLDLTKALESDLFWSEARFYLGRTLLALERDENDILKAVDSFGDVITNIEKPFAPAYFWRAQALRLLGKANEAVRDYKSALDIDPDDALALNALAYCSEHGVGCKPNLSKAEKLYEKSAESGFTLAKKNLAWFYSNEEYAGFENAERSAYWMREAANDGDAEAQNLYALRILHGKGAWRDAYQAVRYFERAAKQDYAPAICNLAECCELGVGTQKNFVRASGLYKQAADLGLEAGKYNLGRCYYFGLGINEDNDKAFEILKPLADGGHAGAQDIIGMCYENGYGTTQNLKLAGRYFRMSYHQGNAHAALHLAARYRAGRGVKKNLSSAVKLYHEAATLGSSYAYTALGRLYYEDKHDYSKAADAFRGALSENEPEAAVWLARSLLLGKNPHKNTGEIHDLLLRSFNDDENKLVPAIFLSTLELFGFIDFPLNPPAAVNRILDLIRTQTRADGLSCAYTLLAQARELGLGIEKDAEAAHGFYLLAEAAGRDGKGCRCFVAGLAHVLFKGVGCNPNAEAAASLLKSELQAFPDNTDSGVVLLYIWHELAANPDSDIAALTALAKKLAADEPNDVLAAYMLYFLRRNEPDSGKLLKRLDSLLVHTSPYYRQMVREHLKKYPDVVLYPVLTEV